MCRELSGQLLWGLQCHCLRLWSNGKLMITHYFYGFRIVSLPTIDYLLIHAISNKYNFPSRHILMIPMSFGFGRDYRGGQGLSNSNFGSKIEPYHNLLIFTLKMMRFLTQNIVRKFRNYSGCSWWASCKWYVGWFMIGVHYVRSVGLKADDYYRYMYCSIIL